MCLCRAVASYFLNFQDYIDTIGLSAGSTRIMSTRIMAPTKRKELYQRLFHDNLKLVLLPQIEAR